MDWNAAKDTITLGLLGFMVWLVKVGVTSLVELNVKIAVVVDKVAGHEDRIKRLEERH